MIVTLFCHSPIPRGRGTGCVVVRPNSGSRHLLRRDKSWNNRYLIPHPINDSYLILPCLIVTFQEGLGIQCCFAVIFGGKLRLAPERQSWEPTVFHPPWVPFTSEGVMREGSGGKWERQANPWALYQSDSVSECTSTVSPPELEPPAGDRFRSRRKLATRLAFRSLAPSRNRFTRRRSCTTMLPKYGRSLSTHSGGTDLAFNRPFITVRRYHSSARRFRSNSCLMEPQGPSFAEAVASTSSDAFCSGNVGLARWYLCSMSPCRMYSSAILFRYEDGNR